jgi:phospholipid-binding lipoprotein MlaA
MKSSQRLTRWSAIVMAAFLLTACATTVPGAGSDPRDPYENYNRSMFTFNKSVDDNVLKPVATGYVKVVPNVVREAIGNFFANIGDVWTAANNYLQGKPKDGTTDLVRVIFNSTIGIAGLIDVATPMGLPKHEEDFGQTLGYYGLDSGAYLVLPLLGPSSTRDGIGFATDAFFFDPIGYINDDTTRWATIAIAVIDKRAELMDDFDIRDKSFDPYAYMRDTYLQNRENLVRDGAEDPNGVRPYTMPFAN